jgi:GT2 family glycosyltransferase
MEKAVVVILNYNGKTYLDKFLPSLYQNVGHLYRILVADNNSDDGSIELLNSKYKHITVAPLDKNYGFSEGYNVALKNLSAEYYVLLNSDVEVTEDFITPIIEYMDTNPSVAAAQPKILNYNKKDSFEYGGACGGYIDALGYPFCRGRIFDQVEKDLGQYDNIAEIFWASGAAMIIKSNDFHLAGGFDKDFFAHMEEIDLCYRLKRMSKKIIVYPFTKVYHVGGGTLSYEHENKTYLNFRNSLLLMLKNKTTISLLWVIPFRLILDGLAGIHFILKGKTRLTKAILTAHIDFYKMIKHTWKKRKFENKKIPQKLVNKAGLLPVILPFHYYILGNKRFHTLQFKLFSGKI